MTSPLQEPPGSNRQRTFGTFMTGAGLPVFLLTLTACYEAFLLAVLFAPDQSGPWAEFAMEFKVWCFSYDPRTGGMEWSEVWIMFLEPLFITGIVLLLWHRSIGSLLRLKGLWHHRGAFTAAAATAAFALSGLYLIGLPEPLSEEGLPFPGERIRTAIPPPEFVLHDQLGERIALEDFHGHPVIITGIYAHCTTSCPEILRELRTLLDELPETTRARLRIVAISLNPEYDTTQVMAAVAHAYNFTHPEFRYLNDDPEIIRPLLSRFQFSPVYNPKTRVIDHVNLFILLDVEGKIAYRFNLNPRQSSWLKEAILQLADETSTRHTPVDVPSR